VTKQLINYALWPIITGLLVAYIFTSNQRIASETTSYAKAVTAAQNSVVNIYTRKKLARPHPLANHPYFRQMLRGSTLMQTKMESSLGSGVIVSTDGYILTNHHVISAATSIEVLLADGRVSPATIIGIDAETDLAVIKVELEGITPIKLGSPQNARVGDVVLAIGNPFGVGQTVTQGIISATSRFNIGLNPYESFLQTDAAINPGNSGGALIDAKGKLLGINTSVLSGNNNSVGISFAIPADTAMDVLRAILDKGSVVRGWLGFNAELVQAGDQLVFLVTEVAPNGPAGNAGIAPGDIITQLGDIAIEASGRTASEVAQLSPGTVVDITIVRNGQQFTQQLTIGEKP